MSSYGSRQKGGKASEVSGVWLGAVLYHICILYININIDYNYIPTSIFQTVLFES